MAGDDRLLGRLRRWLAARADPSDGLLDALVVEAGSRARLLALAYGLRTGTLGGETGVHRRRAQAFEFEVEPETAFNVDGELCTRSGTVRFTVDPRPSMAVG